MDASLGRCQLVLSARTQTRTSGSRARVRPQPGEGGKVSDLSLLKWKWKAPHKLNSRVPSQPICLLWTQLSSPLLLSSVVCLWSGFPGSKPKTSPWLLLPFDPPQPGRSPPTSHVLFPPGPGLKLGSWPLQLPAFLDEAGNTGEQPYIPLHLPPLPPGHPGPLMGGGRGPLRGGTGRREGGGSHKCPQQQLHDCGSWACN